MTSQQSSSTFWNRLAVAHQVEILSNSPLLLKYRHVWKNAHWFHDTQVIYPVPADTPASSRRECLSASEIDGVKLMQESLTTYMHSTENGAVSTQPILGGKPSTSTSVNSDGLAILDICSRMLDKAKKTSCTPEADDLQAVFESKLFLAFVSPTEVWILRSSRSLRTLLSKKKVCFSSLFGHSSDVRADVNLPEGDWAALSDPRANFPGCVKWRAMMDTDGLSAPCRAALDRARDVLFLRGESEVVPFLEMIASEVSRSSSRRRFSASLSDAVMEEEDIGDVFDFKGGRQLQANFPFRGSSVVSSMMLWNTSVESGKYSLALQCPFIPSSLSKFLQGAQKLLSSSSFNIKFTLSESSKTFWDPILSVLPSELHATSELQKVCCDLTDALLLISPLQKFQKEAAASVHLDEAPLALTSEQPKDADPTPAPQTKPVMNRRLKWRVGAAPSLMKKTKPKIRVGHSSTSLSLRSLSSRHRVVTDLASQMQKLWMQLKPSQRKALIPIGNSLACMVGEFPCGPLQASISLGEVAKLGLKFSDCIHFFVASSTMCIAEMIEKFPWIEPQKWRSLFWLARSVEDGTPCMLDPVCTPDPSTVNNSNNLLSIASPPLPQQLLCLPEVRRVSVPSRSLFVMVPDLVVADLVSPFVCSARTRVFLGCHFRHLKLWLQQLGEKQRRWEEVARKKIEGSVDTEEMRRTLVAAFPNFRSHVMVVLPFYLEERVSNDSPSLAPALTDKLRHSIHWDATKKGLNELSELQRSHQMSPFHPWSQIPPPSTSRIMVSIVPLNFLEQCQASLDTTALLQMRLSWNDTTETLQTVTDAFQTKRPHEHEEMEPRKAFRVQ